MDHWYRYALEESKQSQMEDHTIRFDTIDKETLNLGGEVGEIKDGLDHNFRHRVMLRRWKRIRFLRLRQRYLLWWRIRTFDREFSWIDSDAEELLRECIQ